MNGPIYHDIYDKNDNLYNCIPIDIIRKFISKYHKHICDNTNDYCGFGGVMNVLVEKIDNLYNRIENFIVRNKNDSIYYMNSIEEMINNILEINNIIRDILNMYTHRNNNVNLIDIINNFEYLENLIENTKITNKKDLINKFINLYEKTLYLIIILYISIVISPIELQLLNDTSDKISLIVDEINNSLKDIIEYIGKNDKYKLSNY